MCNTHTTLGTDRREQAAFARGDRGFAGGSRAGAGSAVAESASRPALPGPSVPAAKERYSPPPRADSPLNTTSGAGTRSTTPPQPSAGKATVGSARSTAPAAPQPAAPAPAVHASLPAGDAEIARNILDAINRAYTERADRTRAAGGTLSDNASKRWQGETLKAVWTILNPSAEPKSWMFEGQMKGTTISGVSGVLKTRFKFREEQIPSFMGGRRM